MESIEKKPILGKKRRRLHFITDSKKRKIKTSKIQEDPRSPSSSDSSSEADSITEEIIQADTQIVQKAQVIELYSNLKTKEKLLLLTDNLIFTFFGSGNFQVIFGETEVMGYEINSEKNKSDFDFDLNKNFFLFKCRNTGINLDKKNLNSVKQEYQKIFNSNNNNNINSKYGFNNSAYSLVDFSVLNLDKYLNRNITLIYFKNISEDFRLLNLNNNYNLTNKKLQQHQANVNGNSTGNNTSKTNKASKSNFSYEQNKQESFLAEERILIESLEIIDTKKFADYVDLDANTLKGNKKFNIFGKKNSGKSTFLVFFINAFLSSLSKNFNENCNLFLLDCDSGQPLISCPYTVSLLEIKKPLLMNFFRQNIYSKLDSSRKIQLALKENNFSLGAEKIFPDTNNNHNKNSENDSNEYIAIAESENNNATDIENKRFANSSYKPIDNNNNDKEEKNRQENTNLLNSLLGNSNRQIELIRSIFVDDNSPANNFEAYLSAVRHLCQMFNTINNFAVERLKSELKAQSNGNRRSGFQLKNINFIRENLKNFLIVNTNGYTSGIGNVINSAINELIEPDYVYFVKNFKAGRIEKGEEFENLIMNNAVGYDNNVITRKYKIADNLSGGSNEKGGFANSLNNDYSHQRLEKTTVLIENSFKLKEYENLNKKNFNRIYHITADLIGDYCFEKTEQNKNLYLNSNEKENNNSLKNNGNNNSLSLERLKLFGNNFYDFLQEKNFCENFLTEISFDDLLISFDFSNFEPINELDVLMALNGKMCTLLLNENNVFCKSEKERYSVNTRNLEENYNLNNEIVNAKCFSNFTVVDSRNLKDKFFKCFCFVYNIDIISRKFIVFSKQLKEEKNIFEFIRNNNKNIYSSKNNIVENSGDFKTDNTDVISKPQKIAFIIYRNANLDKNLYDSVFLKEEKCNKNENSGSFLFEKLLIDSRFDFSGVKEQERVDENGFANNINKNGDKQKAINFQNNEGYYFTRNKFSLI